MYSQSLSTTFFANFSRIFSVATGAVPCAAPAVAVTTYAPAADPEVRIRPPRNRRVNDSIGQFVHSCGKYVKILLWLVVTASITPVWADTVTLAGRPPFRNVQVVGFRDSVLVFRGAAGELLRIPLAEVSRIEMDGLARFSAAERLAAAAEWQEAAAIYLEDAENAEGWRRALILTRALPVLDRAGDFESAVKVYIDLSQLQSPQAVGYSLKNIGPKGSQQNAAARLRLGGAVRTVTSTQVASELRRLHEEIAIIDDVAEPEPQITGQDDGPAILSRRQSARKPPVTAKPVLRAASVVFEVARKHLDAGDFVEAKRILDRAIPLLEASERGNWRVKLLLERCRIETGEPAAAAAELLAIAESAEPDTAVEALYYAAVAHARFGRTDVSIGVLRRLSDDPRCGPALYQRIAAQLAELEAGAAGVLERSAADPAAEKK